MFHFGLFKSINYGSQIKEGKQEQAVKACFLFSVFPVLTPAGGMLNVYTGRWVHQNNIKAHFCQLIKTEMEKLASLRFFSPILSHNFDRKR